MSQEKVTRNKNAKNNRKKQQKKKSMQNLAWIIAGCVIFSLLAGFCLGRYWFYPKYVNPPETGEDTVYDSQDRSLELQDLNQQIEENE